jgi:hypothetical protein
MTNIVDGPETEVAINPLTKYFRVPGLDVTLPTQGMFFPAGTASLQEGGTASILPMRAADELLLKHPDMLLSGKAIEELIRSCVPAIHDPMLVSTPDLDVLLLAIRAATYGDEMEVQADCPNCGAENLFGANLPMILQNAKVITEEDIQVRLSDDLVVYVRPYNFKDATRLSIMTFNETRKVQNIENTDEEPDAKVKQMNTSMESLTKLSVEIMSDCVVKIMTPDGEVTDRNHIRGFVVNTTRNWTSKIDEKLQELNEKGIDKSVKATCSSCKHEWDTSIEFDPASFFDSGS